MSSDNPDHQPSLLLSFDLEEYFQIEAARPYVPRGAWAGWPSRIEAVVEQLLDVLHQHNARATFFTLGWIARHHPAMVRKLTDHNHEIACHGDHHERLHLLTPRAFADDVARAKQSLEDLTGAPVLGYRAPTFSLVRSTAWAVEKLIDAGFEYDSSVQPIRHPQYGERSAPRWPYRLLGKSESSLLEIPPLTLNMVGVRLPVGGGGYFRAMPLGAMKAGIKQAQRRGWPAMVYFHPWEFDETQPRMPLGTLGRWRTYVGLRHTRKRLERLLASTQPTTVRDWLNNPATPQPADWNTFRLAA